jgi:type IV pilus assembly protein PilM
MVNAGREAVTTAIVKAGVLLLHRTVDLGAHEGVEAREELGARLQAEFGAERLGAELAAVGTAVGTIEREIELEREAEVAASETAQAVSVAAAYFEDTLEAAPEVVLTAGTLGADGLTAVLDGAEVGPVRVQEMVDREMLGAGVSSVGIHGGVPFGWLAGVRGALAN